VKDIKEDLLKGQIVIFKGVCLAMESSAAFSHKKEKSKLRIY
jgi:hypothetical protein